MSISSGARFTRPSALNTLSPAAITGTTLINSHTGPVLPLTNAVIRFVKVKDNRGEGLSAIDIKTPGRAKAVFAARNHQLETNRNHIIWCGLRINLV